MTILAASDDVRRRSTEDVGPLWRELALQKVWGETGSFVSIRERIESTLSYDELSRTVIFEDEDIRQIALLELLGIAAKAAHLTVSGARPPHSGRARAVA
jgi:hypothetical protein